MGIFLKGFGFCVFKFKYSAWVNTKENMNCNFCMSGTAKGKRRCEGGGMVLKSYLSKGEVVRSLFRTTSSGVPTAHQRRGDGASENRASKTRFFLASKGAPKEGQRSTKGVPTEYQRRRLYSSNPACKLPGSSKNIRNNDGSKQCRFSTRIPIASL